MSKSLIEIQSENSKLTRQLNTLLQNARDNEKKLQRFEQIEFQLMQADSIHDVFEVLLFDYPKLFKLSFSSLVLADCELNIKPIINKNRSNNHYVDRVKLLHLPKQLDKLEYFSKAIYLGPYIEHRYSWLVESTLEKSLNIRSIAIIPLIRHDKPIGVFCCASQSADRFEPGFGSDFMKRLGFVIGVCFENAINLEKLKYHTLTDPLTKVRNRRFFEQSLLEEITRVRRSHLPLSCVLLDIDHFKMVNDKYGHRAGDQVLIQVVKRILLTLRTHEILVRYGGEEFALLLPETENIEALRVAQRIIEIVREKPIEYDENSSLAVTISAGVSTYTLSSRPVNKDMESAERKEKDQKISEQLVHNADLALYNAKRNGRNQVSNSGDLELN